MTDSDFSIRPVFVGAIALLTQMPLQLFFTLWCGGFFGGMFTSFGLLPPGRNSFIFFGALAFFGVPLVSYLGKKLNYQRTEYRFHSDRLEFEEGFFTINKKIVKFRDVKEVTLRKGILQRMYGLGTGYLATLATGTTSNNNPFSALGFGNVSASGIKVQDIRNPDEAFEKIQRIVEATNAQALRN